MRRLGWRLVGDLYIHICVYIDVWGEERKGPSHSYPFLNYIIMVVWVPVV